MADIQFPSPLNVTVKDNNGAPSSVLEADTDFTIHAKWSIDRYSAAALSGKWELAAYVESIGQGPEKQIGLTAVVPLNGGTNYSATIKVPAGSLPDDPAPPTSGVYKLVTVLLLRGPFGKVSDVAGFVEGPPMVDPAEQACPRCSGRAVSVRSTARSHPGLASTDQLYFASGSRTVMSSRRPPQAGGPPTRGARAAHRLTAHRKDRVATSVRR
jgi:hypothetical protein